MSVAPDLRQNRSSASWISRACEWASDIGIYLLPFFYLAFFAMLFLLWHEPGSTFWLTAACGALSWAMTVGAIVFCLANAKPGRALVARHVESAPPGQPRLRPVPLQFAQMPTRSCSQSCSTASGGDARFSVACFHSRCQVANSGDAHGIGGARPQAKR
ncbi:hypothetical protein LMG28688_05425 [Paraburkholderia caffeinitolerans]|uniref:Uncharacterized protein n=1 Tax=Paraburkholderia caffeinitolerans TaxID=1723730 RepID=A0A6J5GK55_9BURK|nr:hypothetical protein [Paraburkholderia caffeinitolerans]CAB3801727.1 hypothetical protein LMG28688_05425 [Paraburkholderia caffeinitolerans]